MKNRLKNLLLLLLIFEGFPIGIFFVGIWVELKFLIVIGAILFVLLNAILFSMLKDAKKVKQGVDISNGTKAKEYSEPINDEANIKEVKINNFAYKYHCNWKKQILLVKAILGLALSFALAAPVFLISSNIDLAGTFCGVFAIAFFIVSEINSAMMEHLIKKSMQDIADVNNSILYVNKLSPHFAKSLEIELHRSVKIKHEDEKYIFTSATVGGITTGGVTKVGGYDYIASSKKTGAYYLLFCEKTVINRIELEPSLYEAAKQSSISKYLDDSTQSIVVIEEKKLSSSVLDSLRSMGLDQAICFPTKEKCQEIINWLSGEK